MEYNPEAIEDAKRVVTTDEQGNPITRQNLTGGGVVVERDVEAGDNPVPAATTTTTQPATVTITTSQPTTTRQTVRPSPTSAGTSKQTQSTEHRGWLHMFASRSQGRYFFPLHGAIVFFSFLVLVAASLIENLGTPSTGTPVDIPGGFPIPVTGSGNFIQYAVVVAQFSFAASLGACVMERLGLLENPHIRIAISAFQLFFWAPALVLLTFFGAFISPVVSPNGFFGTWFALLAAATIFSHEAQRARPERRNSSAPVTSLLLLFFAGLMIMGSGIAVYNQQQAAAGGFNAPGAFPWNYTIFSIAYGSITAFLSILLLFMLEALPAGVMLALAVLVWLWVSVGALICTFANPFRLALSNGYYSCLFALVASIGLLVSLRDNHRPESNTNNRSNIDRESESSASFFTFVKGGTFASLVVLVAASLTCRNNGGCDGNIQRFQIAAGAVPLGLGLIVIVLELVGLHKVHSFVKIAFAFIWLAWWIGSFIVLTWYGTFQSPVLGLSNSYANGFFFTWIALVFAALAFAEALKERAHSLDPPSPLTAKTGFLLLVIIGSLIEMGAGIKVYKDVGSTPLTNYAIVLGVTSVGITINLFFLLFCLRRNYQAHDSAYNGVLYFLTLWWAIGALILTFDQIWISAIDNGYFSVFFTLGMCLLALSGIWRTDDDDFDHTTGTTVRRQTTGTATTTTTQQVPPAQGATATAKY